MFTFSIPHVPYAMAILAHATVNLSVLPVMLLYTQLILALCFSLVRYANAFIQVAVVLIKLFSK